MEFVPLADRIAGAPMVEWFGWVSGSRWCRYAAGRQKDMRTAVSLDLLAQCNMKSVSPGRQPRKSLNFGESCIMTGDRRQDAHRSRPVRVDTVAGMLPGEISDRFAALRAKFARNTAAGPGKLHYMADPAFGADALDRHFFDVQVVTVWRCHAILQTFFIVFDHGRNVPAGLPETDGDPVSGSRETADRSALIFHPEMLFFIIGVSRHFHGLRFALAAFRAAFRQVKSHRMEVLLLPVIQFELAVTLNADDGHIRHGDILSDDFFWRFV
jgi:hypothetical protein